jgi:transposase
LTVLSPAFDALYSDIGRPSIPPEKLLRALLLQAFYSVRSERQLMEQLDYNLLFRWFVDLAMDAPIWDVTVFTKNRDRFLAGDVATQFFQAVLSQPQVRALLSDEHFSVDGTLIEAWASMKSFKPKAETTTAGTGAATHRPTSRARSARMRPMRARPIPTPCCTAKSRQACSPFGCRPSSFGRCASTPTFLPARTLGARLRRGTRAGPIASDSRADEGPANTSRPLHRSRDFRR